MVSQDCDGFPDIENTDLVPRFIGTRLAQRGDGALRVRDPGSPSMGSLTYETDQPSENLSTFGITVRPADAPGPTPAARWVITSGAHVLTSDDVTLEAGTWTDVILFQSTFHEGNWSGSLHEYVEMHGHPQMTISLFTGGCLGSPEVLVDTLHMGKHPLVTVDLEPGVWFDKPGAPDQVRIGQTVTVRGTLNIVAPDGRVVLLQRGTARLFRRNAGITRWRAVASGVHFRDGRVAVQIRPRKTAFYQWRFSGRGDGSRYLYPVRSPEKKILVVR